VFFPFENSLLPEYLSSKVGPEKPQSECVGGTHRLSFGRILVNQRNLIINMSRVVGWAGKGEVGVN
jgi:hypothetical protein